MNFHNTKANHFIQKQREMIIHVIEQHLQLPPSRLLTKRIINHLEQADPQARSIKYCTGLKFQDSISVCLNHQLVSTEDNFLYFKSSTFWNNFLTSF